MMRVGSPVAAGVTGWGCDAVERAFLQREVGVEVDVGRALLLMLAERQRDHGRADLGLQERYRGGVPEDVLVPTSAQAPLCRPPRYADLDKHVLADSIIVALGSA
jgi:hypothetical protein